MQRQAHRKHAHRTAILDAAEELVALNGSQVSVEEIASRSGLAKGTVYNHFADKDDLLAQVAQRVRAEAAARVAEAVSEHQHAADRIAAGMLVYVELVQREPSRGSILIELVHGALDPAAGINAPLLEEIERGNDRREINVRPAHTGVLTVLTMVHTAMLLARGGPGRKADLDGAHAMIRLALRALGVRNNKRISTSY